MTRAPYDSIPDFRVMPPVVHRRSFLPYAISFGLMTIGASYAVYLAAGWLGWGRL
jgi:hypothetical protein